MRPNALRFILLLSGLATAQDQAPADPVPTPAPASVGPDGGALSPSDSLCLLHKELCLTPPVLTPPVLTPPYKGTVKPKPPNEKTSVTTKTIISVETSQGQTRTVTVGQTVTVTFTDEVPPKPTQQPPQPPPPQPKPSTVTERPQPTTVTQPGQETTRTITESRPGSTQTIVQPPPTPSTQPPKESSKETPKQPSQTQPQTTPIVSVRPSESRRTSRGSQTGPGPSGTGRPTSTRPVVTVGEAARATGAVMIGALLGGAAAMMNM